MAVWSSCRRFPGDPIEDEEDEDEEEDEEDCWGNAARWPVDAYHREHDFGALWNASVCRRPPSIQPPRYPIQTHGKFRTSSPTFYNVSLPHRSARRWWSTGSCPSPGAWC
jgi:hypothetical protein